MIHACKLKRAPLLCTLALAFPHASFADDTLVVTAAPADTALSLSLIHI
ncbi:hypothetical protein [Pluralibacter gergoviae]|nr:hypothetical protein AZ044_000912 [Pluralibacter gergoviae]